MSRPFCSHVAMLQDGASSDVFFCKQISVGTACRFQNECNKVEIALRVVQFWSEIKLVITNRTPALLSCNFVITRLISDQIALHSVQLPLLINAKFISLSSNNNIVLTYEDYEYVNQMQSRNV